MTISLEEFKTRLFAKQYKKLKNTDDYDNLSKSDKADFINYMIELAESEMDYFFFFTNYFIQCFNLELAYKFTLDLIESKPDIIKKENFISVIRTLLTTDANPKDVFYFPLQDKLIKFCLANGLSANENENNIPLIHYVATKGNVELMKLLIQKGANINKIDGEGDSVLSASLYRNENFEMFEYLFDLNKIDLLKGENVLAIALNAGYTNVLEKIKNSVWIKNENFLNNAINEDPKDIDLFLSTLEKEHLESNLNKTNLTKKIKI